MFVKYLEFQITSLEQMLIEITTSTQVSIVQTETNGTHAILKNHQTSLNVTLNRNEKVNGENRGLLETFLK